MRDYGKVYSSFWSSETTRSMSEDARMLAVYLMTSPHSTITGVFRLPDGYVCEDMQWSPERVAKGFVELFDKGFANRCETTKWVWVCKHLEWNPPENPNQRKSALKIAQSIPDECCWKPVFMRVSGPLLGIEGPESSNPSATVPEPLLNQKQEQKQKQKQKQEKEKSASPPFVLPDWIPAEAWAGYVEMRNKNRKAMTPRARQMVVKELEGMRVKGIDLEAVLNNSTRNNWTDVYEPKVSPAKQSNAFAGAL